MSKATRHALLAPWRQLPGFATDIGAGGGTVWILGRGSEEADFGVYQWDEAHRVWVQEPTGTTGRMEGFAHLGAARERPLLGPDSSIAADEQGRPWVTDEAERTFRLDGLIWERLPGQNIDIDLGGDTAWGIGAHPRDTGGRSLYMWDESGRTWHRDPVAYGVRVAVDDHGVPWHINAQSEIYRGIAFSARNVGGAGTDIGAGGGAVWLVGTNKVVPRDFGIWMWDEESSRWLQDGTGAGTRIAVDSGGFPWVVNSRGSIFRKD